MKTYQLNAITMAAVTAICILFSNVPAQGQPNNTPFMAVDFNGGSGELQTAAPEGWPDWPTWQGWEFTNPVTGGPSWSKTFGSLTATITKFTDDDSDMGSRNRSEPNGGSDQYLSNLYKDFIYVQRSPGINHGRDYMKLDFSGLEPSKPYEFTAFNWDAYYTPANEEIKYMAWGLESPGDYPAYPPTLGGGGLAPKIARILMSGADPCDPNLLDAFHYSGSFVVQTNGDGELTLYTWADNDSWSGSQHGCINGFAIGVEVNANNPSPSDGESDVSLAPPTLSWSKGFWAQDANGHQVYFGTDYNEVSNADTSTAGIYLGNPTETSYQITSALSGGTSYYWRVDEVNDTNTPGYWKGQVWEFSTTAFIFTKCTVKAGKTQFVADSGPDANDVSMMKDCFDATGTVVFPSDLNDITQLDVNIISTVDDEVVYTESIDFNAATDVSRNKYKYSYKIPKGTEGAITSLKMDFAKNTMTMKAKNIDLTGLRSPVQIDIGMGNAPLSGQISEAVINKKKLIPTRLMRLYENTLVVTKVKAKDGTGVDDASFSVKGDIADADMDLDINEPDLAELEVVFTWSDADETNIKTYTLPEGSFVASSKGHSYKCSKAPADEGGLVTAKIDLDKCTFTVSIKGTDDIYVGPGDAKFGISYNVFNGSDEYTIE